MNESNDIKLTIAIPTRNRCESLKKVVNEVCNRVMVEDAVNKVKILVVDDSSSEDNTKAYIQSLMKDYIFLSYYCVDDLGFDYKLLKCFELSDSKYVWVINDHSSMFSGVITPILDSIAKADYWYIFAPTKGDLKNAQKVNLISNKSLGFINTVLNTSIFNRDRLIPYYKKYLQYYDNSWLVFQIANLDMLFDNLQSETLLLQFECTEYGKYMDLERKKNTWGANWNNYIRTGYNGAKLLEDIKRKYSISDAFYNKIFNRRDWGIGACMNYIKLRRHGNIIEMRTAEVITGHPTYNNIEKFIITGALRKEHKWQVIYKSILVVYILLYAPSQYRRILNKLIQKIVN